MNNCFRSMIPGVTTTEGDYEYSISNDEITIVKYLGADTTVIIPEIIEGYPVVTIGNDAFINNIKLSNITLSNATIVGAKAFSGCSGLTTVIGDNITAIEEYGFYNCISLKSISIPKVEGLGIYCFANCNELESINISLITVLSDNLFSNCYKIKNVDISKVKTMGKFVFEKCIALENISAPEAVSIDCSAFCYSGIKTVNLQKVETIGYDGFIGCESLEEISLLAAKEIGDNAFMNSGIMSIELPSITTLGNKTFNSCNRLKCMSISNKVIEIGEEVFANSLVEGVTIDYGQDSISLVTEDDWYSFAIRLTGLDVDNVLWRYVKNDNGYISFNDEFTDTEDPVITLIGENPMELELGLSNYNELGAIVIDNTCEVIEPVISGTVNTGKLGQYTVSYNATDSSGNKAIQVNRMVNVIDTTPPIIVLVGPNPTILEVGLSTYIEQGAAISDNSGEAVVLVISGVVNTSKIGQYNIIYTATDKSGNVAKETRIVNVVDTTSPIINLKGDNPMTISAGTPYVEPGATVTDNSSEIIVPIISGTVDTSKSGQYTMTYTATDSSGNICKAYRTVNVVDTTPPVITLVGDNPMTLEVGLSTYIEPGATVWDDSGAIIVPVISGSVNTSKIGQYLVYYDATDNSGNKAKQVTRIVNVIDTTSPVIYLKGDIEITLEVGLSTYKEPGVVVTDNSGELITTVITGTVNTKKIGKYIISYDAIDSSGNRAVQVNRTVEVVDTTAPTIRLNGANPMTIEVGTTAYNEPGASVTDNSGETLMINISGTVNTKKIGSYNVTYTTVDSSGNSAVVIRIVNVIDTIGPVVYLAGANPMSVEVGLESYIEPGANVSDASGEVIVPVISGYVDNKNIGQYFITYTATDSSGNKTVVVRTVNVIDRTAPVITLAQPNPYYVTVKKQYEDPGAYVTDNSGETIAAVLSGTVDISTVGTYSLTYNAVDSSGNKATPVVRTVKVVTNSVIKCSKIITVTSISYACEIDIVSVIDGKVLYNTGYRSSNDGDLIDLGKLNLAIGTQVRVKDIIKGGKDILSSEIIQYAPDENDICANYEIYGTTVNSEVRLISLAPYYFKCRYVSIYMTTDGIVSCELYTLDDVQLCETGNEYNIESFDIDLNNLEVEPGTRLKMKGDIENGYDTWAINRIEYSPDGDKHGWFELLGTKFDSEFAFWADNYPDVED